MVPGRLLKKPGEDQLPVSDSRAATLTVLRSGLVADLVQFCDDRQINNSAITERRLHLFIQR